MTNPVNGIAEDDALKGKCILLTRPLYQSLQLAARLRSHGAAVEELALIRICPPDSWEAFDQAFAQLDLYAWLLFASTNAIETTLARAQYLNLNERIKGTSIACIGPSTAAALTHYGLSAKFMPSNAVAESLVEEFPQAPQQAHENSKRILWPRTNIGRRVIKDALEKLGWQVDIVHSYKTEGPEDPQASASKLRLLLQSGRLTAITLTSSETARNLREILSIAFGKDSSIEKSLLAKIKLAAIGPETARTCRSIFGRVDIQATEYTVQGLVAALIDN